MRGHLSTISRSGIWFSIFFMGLASTACKTALTRPHSQHNSVSEAPQKAVFEPQFFPVDSPTDTIIYQNRTITRNYYFGSRLLDEALFGPPDGSPFEANWLHFGIWGSLRAGESIDGSDLDGANLAKDMAFNATESALQWLPQGLRADYIKGLKSEKDFIVTLHKIIEHSLAAGNRRVADEIMGLADRYIRMLGCEKTFDEHKLQAFLDTFVYQLNRKAKFAQIWALLLNDIPALAAGKRHDNEKGQDALALAFTAYHKAKFEIDPNVRVQMMHYGNLLIAIHEQFVLQTYISGALGLLDPASSLYRKVATILAMDIGVPGSGFDGVTMDKTGLKRVKLRHGFPASGFSQSLKTYSWPPLVEVARITGVDRNSGRGASDWSDYLTRVHLIAGMLRTLHRNPTISLYPYGGPHQPTKLTCSAN